MQQKNFFSITQKHKRTFNGETELYNVPYYKITFFSLCDSEKTETSGNGY